MQKRKWDSIGVPSGGTPFEAHKFHTWTETATTMEHTPQVFRGLRRQNVRRDRVQGQDVADAEVPRLPEAEDPGPLAPIAPRHAGLEVAGRLSTQCGVLLENAGIRRRDAVLEILPGYPVCSIARREPGISDAMRISTGLPALSNQPRVGRANVASALSPLLLQPERRRIAAAQAQDADIDKKPKRSQRNRRRRG